ncbi:MAG: elongation factor P [Alphaproteobacteria bacterium]|jgi:elongation factor P|nr:elongation factor P [Alphaproteobacteria bacterium]
MKIQANTIRPGNVIEHADKQWTVLKTEMLLPGKGNAFIQVEMRDVKSGNKTNERFRTSETVEKLMVEEKDATYLYAEDDQITFMDSESYEQFTVDKESIGDPAAFLQDGMIVTAELIDGAIAGVRLPQHVTVEVIEADPVVKGQTASSSYKPSVVENNVRVMVPPHIEAGTRIVVNTEDASYVERAKD